MECGEQCNKQYCCNTEKFLSAIEVPHQLLDIQMKSGMILKAVLICLLNDVLKSVSIYIFIMKLYMKYTKMKEM